MTSIFANRLQKFKKAISNILFLPTLLNTNLHNFGSH